MSIHDCINSFLNHVESLDIADNHGNDGYNREFKAIINKQRKWISECQYPATAGEKAENLVKNRYKDILPYDHSRVVLPTIDGEENSDYINANFVKGVTGKKAYIASQGPQPATVDDFWRMLWHFRINVVIMACNEYEGIKLKCKRYWPEKDKELTFFNDNIKVTLVEEHDYKHYLVRILQVACEQQTRLIYQLHYQAWPDHGIPTAIEPILDMLAYARQYQPTESVPIVVHCSAGCGRTGTVIALDYTWSLLKEGKLTLNYSIYDLILEFRTQRQSLVQSEEQYLFVYMAVKELFQRHLNLIEEHFYENVEIIRNAARAGQLQEAASRDDGENEYQVVQVAQPKAPPSRPVPANFNENFPSPTNSNIPDNAKTPEVPKLLPVPTSKRNKRNDNANTSPRGPPKPDRIFATDSPTNTTIRNTLNRLYSSSSDTDSSDMYANVGPGLNDPKSTRTTPKKLSLNSISEDKPAKPSPTTPKPRLTSDSSTKPAIKAKKPTTPEKPPRDGARKSGGVKSLISNFDRAASVDSGAEALPRQASLSDSSSANTVFTSDKGSPSGTSDISVFGSESVLSENTPSPHSKNTRNSAGKGKKRVDLATSSSSEYELQTAPCPNVSSEYSLATDETVTRPKPNSPMDCSGTAQYSVNTDNLHNAKSPVDTRGKCAIPEDTGAYEPVEWSKTESKPSPVKSDSVEFGTRERIYSDIADVELDDSIEQEIEECGDAYAYAGVEDKNKWSLQHIALNKPQPQAVTSPTNNRSSPPAPPKKASVGSAAGAHGSTYSEPTAEDEDQPNEVFSSGDEEEPAAPALPQKLYSAAEVEELKKAINKELVHRSQSDTSETGADPSYVPAQVKFPQTGTIGRVFARQMDKLQRKKLTKEELTSTPTAPPVVQYKGKVISFGNRVVKPKGGRNNAFKPHD